MSDLGEELAKAQPGRHADLPLIVSVLAPALIFLGDQGVSYAVVHPVCEGHERWVLFVISAVAVALLAWTGVIGWTRLISPGGEPSARHEERRRFLALAAVILSLFFTVLVVGLVLAKALVGPCAR